MWKTWSIVLCCLASIAAGETPKRKVTCHVRVIDAKARPVAGAEVVAYEDVYDYADGQIHAALSKTYTTGADGRVSVDVEVARGIIVWVVARKPGLALGWDRFGYTDREPKVNIVLEPPTALGGTVVDESGGPIAGASVRLIPTSSLLHYLSSP